MLTVEQNKTLTEVGPGTPMGDLLRHYWHPIAGVQQLDEKPFRTLEIELMGEELVLFRDLNGELGLIERYCSHRRVNLARGMVEQDGVRCPYHGWKFGKTGECLEQPFETTQKPEGTFRKKCGLKGYHVQEYCGLIWGYIGPEPVPYLPKWPGMRNSEAIFDVSACVLECNWLQCQENSPDPLHSEWLHRRYSDYVTKVQSSSSIVDFHGLGTTAGNSTQKIRFREFEHGQVKMRLVEGDTGEEEDWTVGHPTLFPNGLATGCQWHYIMQFRVPMNDTRTYHVSLHIYPAAPGTKAPKQDVVPYRDVPLYDENGDWIVDTVFNQDYMAWVEQGAIAQRDKEKLGFSDVGIIEYRKMLFRAIEDMKAGRPIMNRFLDQETAETIDIPIEKNKHSLTVRPVYLSADGKRSVMANDAGISADADKIEKVLETWDTIPEHARPAAASA